jgi:hypothetical protein
MKKPRIKFNGGNPVALCDECSVITEYVTYNEDDSVTIRDTNEEAPLYCIKCSELKAIEKAKAIISSCSTYEHFDSAMKYLDQYLKTYSNGIIYKDLVELMNDRKTEINFNKHDSASN